MDERPPPAPPSPASLDASAGPERLTPLELLAGQDFLTQEPRGLVVNLAKLENNARLVKFVARAFQSGCYLKGLNYKNLAALLYDFDKVKASLPQVILAVGLAQMDLGRLMLYQGELTLNAQEAHYDFTFQMDSRMAFASGVKTPSGDATRDLGEFVAVLWNRGVRFGLDLSGVGAGLLLSRQQKYVPIFQPGDKISLAFKAGGEPLDLEMVVADVRESSQVVRIGGFFVNLPAAQQAIVYRLKNALEARLRGEGGGR